MDSDLKMIESSLKERQAHIWREEVNKAWRRDRDSGLAEKHTQVWRKDRLNFGAKTNLDLKGVQAQI